MVGVEIVKHDNFPPFDFWVFLRFFLKFFPIFLECPGCLNHLAPFLLISQLFLPEILKELRKLLSKKLNLFLNLETILRNSLKFMQICFGHGSPLQIPPRLGGPQEISALTCTRIHPPKKYSWLSQ